MLEIMAYLKKFSTINFCLPASLHIFNCSLLAWESMLRQGFISPVWLQASLYVAKAGLELIIIFHLKNDGVFLNLLQ